MGWPIGFCRRPRRSSKTKTQVGPILACRPGWATLVLGLLAATGGCEGPSAGGPDQATAPLTSRIKQLQDRVALLETENQALRRQAEPAFNLPVEAGVKAFYKLQRIRLTRYTGLYDKDKNGTKEKLIVYVQPVDQAGDVVKACGSVDVQLWDLSADPNRALLGSWHADPQELHKMWFATLVTINYRLVFDRPQGTPDDRPLTVKVVFTDDLTGQVFTEQAVISARRSL